LRRLATLFCVSAAGCAGRSDATPVASNRLRPPGAVAEEEFAGRCIRCGRCAEVCPYRSVVPLDVRHGLQAGTPLIRAEEIPCYLCMKCVVVCPTGALRKVAQSQTRMGQAVVDKHACVSWTGEILCRTCYNVCPFADRAIRLENYRPVVDEKHCTGCGICVHGCPVADNRGRRAINVEPVYARSFVLPQPAGSGLP
jgi:MauM/NapG family ferredoxin protein